jgi:hypothetical protein
MGLLKMFETKIAFIVHFFLVSLATLTFTQAFLISTIGLTRPSTTIPAKFSSDRTQTVVSMSIN